MKIVRSGWFIAVLVMVAATAFAEDQKSSGSMSFWEKTKVTGTTDVNYNYNFNKPPNSATLAAPAVVGTGLGNPNTGVAPGTIYANQYRVFDSNANTFNIGLVELALENSPNDWVTIRTDLDFGHDTVFYRSQGLNTGDFFDLQQAYVTLKAASIGNGLTFKVGKFVTMHGNEVIEAAYNNHISRGLLFSYAIPFTHTGILANYSFNDKIMLDLGVVNGWNNVIDNNYGKSFHGMFTIKPTDKITWAIGGTWGPEANDNNTSFRGLLDSTVTYAAMDNLTLAINYDLGHDSAATGSSNFVSWQGLAGYAHWKPLDFFGLSVRGEYWADNFGLSAPINLTAGGVASTKVYEGTLTSHFYVADGLDLRLEFRHDQGNNTSFARSGGAARKFQDTLGAQLVYAF